MAAKSAVLRINNNIIIDTDGCPDQETLAIVGQVVSVLSPLC